MRLKFDQRSLRSAADKIKGRGAMNCIRRFAGLILTSALALSGTGARPAALGVVKTSAVVSDPLNDVLPLRVPGAVAGLHRRPSPTRSPMRTTTVSNASSIPIRSRPGRRCVSWISREPGRGLWCSPTACRRATSPTATPDSQKRRRAGFLQRRRRALDLRADAGFGRVRRRRHEYPSASDRQPGARRLIHAALPRPGELSGRRDSLRVRLPMGDV